MAFPTGGFIKIFPDNVTIVSGDWALNSDAAPQPVRTPATLDAYFDARVTNLSIAPCLRRATENPAASGVYVPAVGTYELQFSASSRDIQFFDNSYPSAPVATLDAISADFPTGMTINQLQVWWTGSQTFGPNRERTLPSIIMKYFGATVGTTSQASGVLLGTFSPSNAIVNSFQAWSITQVLKPFGISIPVNASGSVLTGLPQSIMSECFLLGVYNTLRFQITLDTPMAVPGEIADISDGQELLGVFNDFKIYWDTNPDLGEEDTNPVLPGLTGGVSIPSRYFYINTDARIRFLIPQNLGIPYGGRRLLVYGVANSFLFSGEFLLAQLNILLVDGSGVYQLTPGQRHDTYYDRGDPGETVDLRIPRPFARTGFF